MNNGENICNQYMFNSQSDYRWIDSRSALLGRKIIEEITLPNINPPTSEQISTHTLSTGHILTLEDIDVAIATNSLLSMILAIDSIKY